MSLSLVRTQETLREEIDNNVPCVGEGEMHESSEIKEDENRVEKGLGYI